MSPMRLAALLTAIAISVAVVFLHILEATAHAALAPDPVIRLLCLGAILAWIAFLSAHCRDGVNRHADRNTTVILRAIDQAVEEAGDRRATDARIDTLAAFDQPRPTARIGPVR